jgi:hypothetical protein
LAHRPVAYTFPTIVDAEFVLVDVTDVPGKHPSDVKTVVDRLLSSGSWQLLEAVDGFILLQKMPVTESQILPDSFYSFVRTTQPAPQFPLNLTFGNQLQLLGFDVIEKPFHREVSVRLYWQALTDLTDELTIWPQFYDDFGQPLTDPLSQPSVASRWYPPAHWQTDEVIRIQTLPQNLGETFHLGLAVIHGQDFADTHQRLGVEGAEMSYDQATWAQLASFQWTNWELDTLAPAPTLLDFEPTDQIFAKGLRLTGYHLPGQPINSDEPLKLILSWKTSEPLPIDYTIFLHLVDSQNNILAQNDAQPFWLAPYPTRRWPSNQMILDSHMIQPPLPVGSYQLRLGLYDWQTFERLPLETGQDSLSLGEIEVTGVSEKR